MKLGKLIAAAAVASLVSSASLAAIRPSTANVSLTPAAMPLAGARLGAISGSKRSDMTGASTALIVAGVAAAGLGIAAAAGAFDSNHHNGVSP